MEKWRKCHLQITLKIIFIKLLKKTYGDFWDHRNLSLAERGLFWLRPKNKGKLLLTITIAVPHHNKTYIRDRLTNQVGRIMNTICRFLHSKEDS